MFKFLARRKKDPKTELRNVLGEHDLPSFSGVVMQTLQRMRDPRSSPAAIAAVMAADPGLSVRVLKTVNTAAYSMRKKITSLDQAIGLLGLATVESLVLAVAVKDVLPAEPAPGFDSTRFWRTAARRAATAKALAARLHPAQAAESFTAALLQDMAVPVLTTGKLGKYGSLLEHWHNSNDDLAVLEHAEFGWSHPEVATWMCDEWALPEALASSVGGHHGEVGEGTEGLISPPAVILVSHLREPEERIGSDRLVEAVNEQFGIGTDEVVELVEDSFEAAEELAALFR
jgi:HD-like signal output (HDOD) protein